MRTERNNFYFGIIAFLIAIFLFTRWFGFIQGYELAGDLGRDMHVLEQWRATGKPPLLGPQNSVLPFNQSAIFFYILMPVYALTNWWPYANLLTLTSFILVIWGVSLFITRHDKRWWWFLFPIIWLSILHPQYVAQNRYVWNPSFVAPTLTLGILGIFLLQREWKRSTLFISAMSLAAAVSFSYSVAPVIVLLVLWVMWYWRDEWRKAAAYVLSLVGAGIICNLPTLAFEVRYKFQLTRALLAGPVVEMPDRDIPVKLFHAWLTLLSYPAAKQGQIIVLAIIVAVLALNLYFLLTTKRQWQDSIFVQSLALWMAVMLLTFISPTPLQAHYIFGITSLAIMVLASLRPKIMWAGVAGLSVVWLQPGIWQKHFEPHRLPLPTVMSCAERICQQVAEPAFVTLVSSQHPFHVGPEFRYALQRSGCNVQLIETKPDVADTMIVIEDEMKFEPGKTDFHELSQFGDHTLTSNITCTDGLGAAVLTRE